VEVDEYLFTLAAATEALILPEALTLEAMATGLPVVTTETCGMADIVHDGDNGLAVPPADAPAIAESVVRLTESLDLRRRLGQAAQNDMHHYSWACIAERVERVFIAAVQAQSPAQAAAEHIEKELRG